MSSANEKQQKVIDSIDGIKVVDAGAGTGKTFTISKRYLNILEKSKCDVEDILLVTFTKNAAFNLKEKVISSVTSNIKDKVLDAPICSFDSFCSKLVSSYGIDSPKYLGIKNVKLSNYKLITDNVIIDNIFKKFFNSFLKINEQKFGNILSTISEPKSVYSLIEELLCKGIYPTKTGWFLDGGNKILGNKNEFLARVMELNNPVEMKTKVKGSSLLTDFEKRIKEKKYNNSSINLELDLGNFLNTELLELAFDDKSREIVEEFIHNVYFDFITFMAKNNYMTFSLNSMYAFLILYYDEKARDENSFDYIMIDEFQDTNEMQFMLILLLMKKENLCVVGDWKQGIYKFRNASIENITQFDSKLKYFCEMLEFEDSGKICFDWKNCESEKLNFNVNYRSAQNILDFSVASLTLKGSGKEDDVKLPLDVIGLEAGNENYNDYCDIEFLKADCRDDEIDMILDKINSIVGKKMIPCKTDGERLVRFSDIAILSRTRLFGLDILKRCQAVGCPAVYDGGIYLFSEEPSILLLAWTKLILDVDCRSSWITILEKEELSFLEIERIITNKDYPKKIIDFRLHLLKNRKTISYIVDEIFKKYGFNNEISNQIVIILDSLFNSNLISLSDLVVFIESCINDESVFRVEILNSKNSIKIQTIHGSKGLEYPIVFVVNCNSSNFPMSSKGVNTLFYDKSCGVRCKLEYDSNLNYVFDSWKSDLVSYKLNSDYDEERRLMYVAVTRAMFDVYLTANRPSNFFKEYSCGDENVKMFEKDFKFNLNFKNSEDFDNDIDLSLDIKENTGLVITSPHSFMTYDSSGGYGRGKDFGTVLHNLAFRKCSGLEVSDVSDDMKKDWKNISNYIDNELKDCELLPEVDCSLPYKNYLIRGIIDLVAVYSDRVEVIDWKSDVDKTNLNEYKKQLSVYCEVLKGVYDLPVVGKIFWSYTGECEVVDLLELSSFIE
ncbi:MAG: UvrD-helicase domain-containing protein [Nanoarchaeales archaeon]|nr:UvrD-helicase domain-containing protein [Nanoarchaeales archaeon]